MHAAPGSQNGNDNSSPAVTGQVYWDKYYANQGETIDSIGLYADRYKNRRALLGFDLLNEPALVNLDVLQTYYQRAHQRILQSIAPTIIVINPPINPFQDGTESIWTGFMNLPNVWMSVHFYYCFGGPWGNNPNAIINYARNDRKNEIEYYNRVNPKPMIVDEMSLCGVPNNYEDSFAQAQFGGYDLTRGWMFWAWKNPSGGTGWSLQESLQNGWISSGQMSKQC